METIQQSPITLKLIFQQNWNAFLGVHPTLVTWTIAFNVWKIMNCLMGLVSLPLLAPSIPVKYVMFLIPVKADFVWSVPKFKLISGWQT